MESKMKSKKFMMMNAAALAAMVCVGIGGCLTKERRGASGVVEEKSNEAVVKENVVSNVIKWLKPYQMKIPFVVENEKNDVYIRGDIGYCQALFSKYSICIHLNGNSQKAYCYGYLPTLVPVERRADMIEALFRAECAYGLSSATLVLEDEGMIRCQAWCRLSALERTPEKALPLLVGSVIEKLISCSQMVGSVSLGTGKLEEVSKIAPVKIFERDKFDNKTDIKTVLDACFPDGGYQLDDYVDVWFNNRFGNGDDSVGFISNSLIDISQDLGGIYDELEYTIVVKDGMACNICVFPVEIPRERLNEVAEAAMRCNQSLNCALFCVDFENRKLWCRFSIPVSSFIDDLGTKEMKFNIAELNINTVAEVAMNSELFSKIMATGNSEESK